MFKSFIKHWTKSIFFITLIAIAVYFSIELGAYIGAMIGNDNPEKWGFAMTMLIFVLVGTVGWSYESAKMDRMNSKFRKR